MKFTCVVALTLFQLASTALTVTLNGTPAFCAVGVAAVLPVAVPAAATSPGIRICNLATEPTAGVMEADAPVMGVPSVSVSVVAAARFSVTLKVAVPPLKTVAVAPLGENVPAVGPVKVRFWLPV